MINQMTLYADQEYHIKIAAQPDTQEKQLPASVPADQPVSYPVLNACGLPLKKQMKDRIEERILFDHPDYSLNWRMEITIKQGMEVVGKIINIAVPIMRMINLKTYAREEALLRAALQDGIHWKVTEDFVDDGLIGLHIVRCTEAEIKERIPQCASRLACDEQRQFEEPFHLNLPV